MKRVLFALFVSACVCTAFAEEKSSVVEKREPLPAPVQEVDDVSCEATPVCCDPCVYYRTCYKWQPVVTTEKRKYITYKQVPCKVTCNKACWVPEKREIVCYEPQLVKKTVKQCYWTWKKEACTYTVCKPVTECQTVCYRRGHCRRAYCCCQTVPVCTYKPVEVAGERWVAVQEEKDVEVECWECVAVKKTIEVKVQRCCKVEVDGYKCVPFEEERDVQITSWKRVAVQVPCRPCVRRCHFRARRCCVPVCTVPTCTVPTCTVPVNEPCGC